MTERNTELLERVMRHILDHPEEHNQNSWGHRTQCGTAACFAGWTLLLTGQGEFLPCRLATEENGEWTPTDGEYLWIKGDDGEGDISDHAAGLLGLKEWEANRMFAPSNTRPMLELMVKDLVAGNRMRTRTEYREEAHPEDGGWDL